MSRFTRGQAVVVIDANEPTYLCEGVVLDPPLPAVRKDSVYVSISGDRLWLNDYQLRGGRLDDGVQRIFLSTMELLALVQMDDNVAAILPPHVHAALQARNPPRADTLHEARCNVAASLVLALEKGS